MNAIDQLTKNFRLGEFERSLTASLKGYDNTVPPMAVYALRHLCELFLQPLRDMLAAPVIITSGYRCRDLNREVGGSDTSWHLTGCAADFHPSDDALRPAVIQFVKDWKERGDVWRRNHDEHDEPAVQFTEFIVYPTFFHVAVAPEGTANKFTLKYFNGFGQGYKKD